MRDDLEWNEFLRLLWGDWTSGGRARLRFEDHLDGDTDWPMVARLKRGSRR